MISALTTSSADTTTPPLPAWNAFPYPLKTTLSFSIGPFLELYTIGSLTNPGPVKTVFQPAHHAPSRHANYGSASLHRQDTGSLAHRVLSNSAPPFFFCFCPRCPVDDSLHQPRVRVQFRVLIIFPSVTTFSALVLLVGFSSCPVFGPRDCTPCVGTLPQRTRHWFRSPRFRTWAANLSCLRFLLFFCHQLGIASLSWLR